MAATKKKKPVSVVNFNFKRATTRPDYKKLKKKSTSCGVAAALVTAFIAFYFCLVPLNIHSVGLWVAVIMVLAAFSYVKFLVFRAGCSGWEETYAEKNITWEAACKTQNQFKALPWAAAILLGIVAFSGCTMLNTDAYSSLLTVEDAVFSEDLAQSLDTDSIALMDTNSARMLGDREIGSLASVVSQYNVSDNYVQIDLNGTPKKVAALDYAGFFKWLGNKESGVPGYVIVDPVSMSASYESCEDNMIYVPSAFFGQSAARYIRMHYLGTMFGNLHFEVNEEGKPFYVASVYEKTISLLGGKTVCGAIVLDPATGKLAKYALSDIPTWVDMAFDGDLLCRQYNWLGTLKNGFVNSIIGKKGCKQVTTYTEATEEDDETPVSDYGYVAKDGDIWIYTGVTSVNGDSSNIGFLLANERTGEAHYYSVAGADEKSAMAAAEGEVQEKNYQASFPALINVDDCPTYIMVLKDAGGLVKLYAAVNVQQYNIVTTASTQAACMDKYRALLGIEKDDEDVNETETKSLTITIKAIKSVVIEGDTYLYLISENNEIFKAKAYEHENMLLLEAGNSVELECAGNRIVECKISA